MSRIREFFSENLYKSRWTLALILHDFGLCVPKR